MSVSDVLHQLKKEKINGIHFRNAIEELENPGCNNGNYPMVSVHTTNGDYHGLTCNCRKGCANTWDVFNIEGKEFSDEEELLEYLEY